MDYVELASSIGRLVETKNRVYGDSFAKCGEFLRLLYPDGVRPEQYTDMLAVVRVFDKLMRIATQKDALGEDPWRDTAGYALLAIAAGQHEGLLHRLRTTRLDKELLEKVLHSLEGKADE